MNRNILIVYIVLLIVLAAGGWYWWAARPAVQPVAENPTPVLSADLYPLWNNVNWNAPAAEEVIIGTTTYSGASISSALVQAGMDPASVFTPFERYYDKKLKALGWTVANDLAAGGHVGGQTGYRKDGAVILTRFHVDYHIVPGNAPSECPCDVTVSLFSTEQ